jgi:hypothetical protein
MRTSKLILSTLVFSLAVSPAFAKGKPATAGSDKKSDKATTTHGKKDSAHGKSGEHGENGDHGKKDADHGKNHAKNEHGRDGDPAGYDKGKKTGWGDCDAPPGQEKKTGVDCKDKDKKSGGILGIFKKGDKDKKDGKKVEAKATTTKPAATTTRTSRSSRTTTTTTAAPKPTAAKSTTTTRTTRTARTGTAPDGQDKLEAAKKR